MIVISDISLDSLLGYEDTWSRLKHSQKPIVLYGMGDGADKILNVCMSKGIKVSGVFASDGFASGKLFRGFKVISYSEISQQLDDFSVLLSFASNRPEVLSNIYEISKHRELYCPDVPVFGDGLFDMEFFEKNFNRFTEVWSKLSDETSKKAYFNVIAAKLTGKIDFLKACETDVSEAYESIIKPSDCFGYADIGAYNGDTIREFLSFSKGAAAIFAFEPDAKNYKKLISYADEADIDKSTLYNIAAWDKKDVLTFYSRSGRNSAGTTSHMNCKEVQVKADAADNLINKRVDYINIDAEGSDMNALSGLLSTIKKYKPTVSCAVYHRNEDMFAIPQKLYEMYGGCQLFIRHFPYLPAWDTNVYAKPF